MKKTVILAIAVLLLTGCNSSSGVTDPEKATSSPELSSAETASEEGTEYPKTAPTEYKTVKKVDEDRVIYYDINDLSEASDLIVIGEFCEDTCQNCDAPGTFAADAVSSNVINVRKVLKGEAAETVKISQKYCISTDGELLTFSELTPMKKGDTWLFFLSYDAQNDTYWCAGDFTGRYPLPDDTLRSAAEDLSQAARERDQWIAEHSDEISDSGYTPEQQTVIDGFASRMAAACEGITPEQLGLLDDGQLMLKLGLYSGILAAFDAEI